MFDNWSTLKKLIWLKIRNGGTGPVYKTASGAIVHITDALAAPLKKLVAQITPVQDLHGFDSPWPAGGGVNKFDLAASFDEGETVTTNGVTAKYANGYLKITGTNTSEAGFNIIYKQPTGTLPAGTYIMPNHVTVRAAIDGGSNTNYASAMTANSGIVIVAFYVAINASAADLNWNIPMLLVEGTTKTTTYSPYSNLCPISGWTGLEGQRTGVNVWDEEWEVGSYDTDYGIKVYSANRIRSKNYIPVIQNTQYNFSFPTRASVQTGNIRVLFYDINKSYLGYRNWMVSGPFTTPANTAYITFYTNGTYGETYQNDISINYPSTDTSYHAYSGESLSVSWQSTAGTVYGGSDSILDGALTSNMGKKVFNGSEAWAVHPSLASWFYIDDAFQNEYVSVSEKDFMLSNKYVQTEYTNVTTMGMGYFAYGIVGQVHRLVVKDTRFTTAADFKANLATENLEIVYRFAQPQTFEHEGQQLTTLLGTNNIWVDCGSTEVEYRADTKLYIDKKIAEIVNS